LLALIVSVAINSFLKGKELILEKHMSQKHQLRNRSTGMNNSKEDDVLRRTGAGLSASAMIRASPSQHGAVYKLQVPVMFSILPSFLQRIICSWSCVSFLAPKWKERYLIQIGNYLYRFKDPQSSTPKGAPVPLEQANVRLMSSKDDEVECVALPPSVRAVVIVYTLRKKQYYGVSSREEAMTWLNSIEDGRQEATRRSMGHTRDVPYPKSWEYFDNLGRNFLKSKERIKTKIAESEAREMEMSNFGEGGPAPRGYYG
jgi:hypothetical protein